MANPHFFIDLEEYMKTIKEGPPTEPCLEAAKPVKYGARCRTCEEEFPHAESVPDFQCYACKFPPGG